MGAARTDESSTAATVKDACSQSCARDWRDTEEVVVLKVRSCTRVQPGHGGSVGLHVGADCFDDPAGMWPAWWRLCFALGCGLC